MSLQGPVMPREPETLLAYIEEYADSIYVRDDFNGVWGSYALSELPAKIALKHAFRFIRQGVTPTRILAEGERR